MKPLEIYALFIRAVRGEGSPHDEKIVAEMRRSTPDSDKYKSVLHTLEHIDKLRAQKLSGPSPDFTENLMRRLQTEAPATRTKEVFYAGNFRHRIALGIALLIAGIVLHFRSVSAKASAPHEMLGIYTVLVLLGAGAIGVIFGLWKKNRMALYAGFASLALAVGALACSWFFP